MFLTRSHHEDIIREKNLQIGYRDHRIAQLEAERKLLWDKLCLLEIGEAVFNITSGTYAKRVSAPDSQSGVSELHARELAPGCEREAQIKSQPKASAESPVEGRNNVAQRANGGSEETPISPKSMPDVAVRLGRPRPSQIMRRMDRLMHNRWLQKLRPGKAAEQRRDEVMDELNTVHFQAVATVKKET